MICILAGNFDEAKTWASGQNLEESEWFYPIDENDLTKREDFHVIVIGTAGQNLPISWFNRFYSLAQTRGQIGREKSTN